MIDVVAAVICDRKGRYLVGRRPADKRHGGMWEFPGGKVDDGETHQEAMARELEEELGLALVRMDPETLFERMDPGSRFRIVFYRVEVEGAPEALEHTALLWGTVETLGAMELAPSDAAFVATQGQVGHG